VTFFFCVLERRGLNRARAKREKQSGGLFRCPRACRGAIAPRASLVAACGGIYFTGEGWISSPLTHPPVLLTGHERNSIAKLLYQRSQYFPIRHKTNISRISRPQIPPKFLFFFLALCHPLWYSNRDKNLRRRYEGKFPSASQKRRKRL